MNCSFQVIWCLKFEWCLNFWPGSMSLKLCASYSFQGFQPGSHSEGNWFLQTDKYFWTNFFLISWRWSNQAGKWLFSQPVNLPGASTALILTLVIFPYDHKDHNHHHHQKYYGMPDWYMNNNLSLTFLPLSERIWLQGK